MRIIDVILIGIALSMDACALTIANCTTYSKTLTKKQEWSMPVAFAVFQGVMPFIGYFIGSTFANGIESVSKYFTAGVFFALALKIVIDVIKDRNKEETANETSPSAYGFALLFVQGLATSIDALVIGVTFSFDLVLSQVLIAVSVIAVVTFVFVSVALLFGKYLGKLFGDYAQYVGAVILLALAIKSLF